MNQSAVIAGSLLLAFFVYITLKGELPVYAGLLLLSPSQGTAPTGTAQQQTNAQATDIVGAAVKALALVG
jgi:hypothetical protein